MDISVSSGASLSSLATRKLKPNQVLSQVDETEFELLSEADFLTIFARYEALFGKGKKPPNDKETSSEQSPSPLSTALPPAPSSSSHCQY